MGDVPKGSAISMQLTSKTSFPDDALSLQFVRSSGPGGQNVNKVATAVQLRLDLNRAGLPVALRERLEKLAGRRLTASGEILIEAQRYRSQERNREDALTRLRDLVTRAEQVPKTRTPTRPSRAAKQRRTDTKVKKGFRKRLRGKPDSSDF